MFEGILDYLGGLGNGAGAAGAGAAGAAGAGATAAPSFMQSFGAALGRSNAAGGGLAGLGAALNPNFAKGVTQGAPAQGNAPTTSGGGAGGLNWNTPANGGKLSF